MKNNYGNYVVQKALKLSREENRNRLVNSIVKNIHKIGDGKLKLKWQSIINNYVNISNDDNVSRYCNKKVFKTVVYKQKIFSLNQNHSMPRSRTFMGRYEY
jgi:hypothetical protein